jgi:hypothetical protein
MTESPNRLAKVAVQGHGGAGTDAARAAKLRRSGWLLGLLAIGFYVGFLAWNLLLKPRLGG